SNQPIKNLRFAFRQLLKNPGLTAVAVLTLALGVDEHGHLQLHQRRVNAAASQRGEAGGSCAAHAWGHVARLELGKRTGPIVKSAYCQRAAASWLSRSCL